MKTTYSMVLMKSQERNDCSVLAAQFALNLTYEQAYDALELAGRDRCSRVPSRIFLALGMESRPDLSCMAFGKALEDMQTGRFVVFVKGHFFAVVDGRVYDSRLDISAKTVVAMVYQAPLDNPEFLERYPALKNLVRLDALPDIRSILENRMDLRPTNVKI